MPTAIRRIMPDLNIDMPDVQLKLSDGYMAMERDGAIQLVSPEACEGLYHAKMVRMCNDQYCNILHVHDDVSWHEIDGIIEVCDRQA